MNPRVRTALISVVCFVLAFAAVLIGGRMLGAGDEDGPRTEALTVPDALGRPTGERVAVRGFVFYDEATGPLLCSLRTTDDPPACDGTVMRLENLDPNRLDLVRPENTARAFDAYSRHEVALAGTKLGAVLVVDDVLP